MGSSPGWSYGYVPTAAQWNNEFSSKQDELGFTPLNRAGGSMAGPLTTLGSTSGSAGFRIFQGVAPSSPDDGEMWLTSAGLYVQVSGSTVGPLSSEASIQHINPATTGTIDNMVIGGITPRAGHFTTLDVTGLLSPAVNDGSALGDGTHAWSDLFGATGFVWNIGAGNYTVTHSSNLLTFSKAVTVQGAITVQGALSASPANANVTLSPTGSGIVTVSPGTVGSIDRMNIGATTPGTLSATTMALATGSIASAATTDLSTVSATEVTVTGTTTITSFGTLPAGAIRLLTFSGVLTLTYNGTSLILPTAANIVTAAGDTAVFCSLGSGNWTCFSYQRSSGMALATAATAIPSGQAILSLSGGNLVLSRKNGSLMFINGSNQTIPSAGVTLAATGLTAGTLYYIYAFMNSGTMTLEASTTAYAIDTSTGMPIKTGDATRTLVGMARPDTGPAWIDNPNKRFVRSWFNSPTISLFANFTTGRPTASASFVELNSEIRCEFLIWPGETLQGAGAGSVSNNTASAACFTSIGVDSTTTPEVGGASYSSTNANNSGAFSVPVIRSNLTQGYHFITLLGATSTGTGTWTGPTDGTRSAVTGSIR